MKLCPNVNNPSLVKKIQVIIYAEIRTSAFHLGGSMLQIQILERN